MYDSSEWGSIDGGYGVHPPSMEDGDFYLGIKADGTLWAMGFNKWGNLGLGDTFSRYGPFVSVGTDTWKFASCGGNDISAFSFAIKTDGTLWSTGFNGDGQLGLGNTTDKDEFTQVGSDKWIWVGCGGAFAVAIKENGTLWVSALYGNSFVQMGTTDCWKEVSCGNEHIMQTRI